LRGVNAAVVGLLLAALYQPVWTVGITNAADFALAGAAFLLLFLWQTPAGVVVVLRAAGGAVGAFRQAPDAGGCQSLRRTRANFAIEGTPGRVIAHCERGMLNVRLAPSDEKQRFENRQLGAKTCHVPFALHGKVV